MDQLAVFVEAFKRIFGVIMYISCHMSSEGMVLSLIMLRAHDFILRRPAIS